MTEEKKKSRARHNGACLQSWAWETEAEVLEVYLSSRHSGACLQSRGCEMEAGVLEVRLSPRPVLTGQKPRLPKIKVLPVPQELPQIKPCQ